MRVYRIQRRSDGKFSTGGSYPRFTTKGKSWQQLGHTETEVERTPFGKYLEAMRQKKADEQAERRRRTQVREEAQEKALLAKLKAKYE